MRLYTSSFWSFRGPGRVCIARFPPRRAPAGYRMYRALAPHPTMLKLPFEAYRARYLAEILDPLDPQQVVIDVVALAGTEEVHLQCYENLAIPGKWCHRRLVADWLHERLGLAVDEWTDRPDA